MLPRDIAGLEVPPEAITISRWAPFVQLRAVEEPPKSEERCPSPLERGVAVVARTANALRRAA